MTCRIGSHTSTLVGIVLDSMRMLHIEIVSCIVGHIESPIVLIIYISTWLRLGYFFLVRTDTIIFLVRINQIWSWVALLNSWEEFLVSECPTVIRCRHLWCLYYSSHCTLLNQPFATLSHPVGSSAINVGQACTSVLGWELALTCICFIGWFQFVILLLGIVGQICRIIHRFVWIRVVVILDVCLHVRGVYLKIGDSLAMLHGTMGWYSVLFLILLIYLCVCYDIVKDLQLC